MPTATEPRVRPVAPAAVAGESDAVALEARGSGPRLEMLYTLALAVTGWVVGIAKLGDNSFFWHLRTGRLILQQGIPHTDPYSFTAHGAPWVAQSWLAEVWYGLLDLIGGGAAIRLFGAVLGATIAVVTFRLALRIVGDRVRALALAMGAFACLAVMWSPRPLVIAVLLFLALVWIVECPDTWLGRHELVAVPVVLWIWATVHGTFELGLAYLALHLVGRFADGAPPWKGRERRIVLATAIASVVVFANPYGSALILFPVQLLSRGHILSHVVEWKSPDFRTLPGQMLALWLVAVLCVLARTRHRVSRRDLVVTIPFVLLSLWAMRNIALVGFATLPVVARALVPAPSARLSSQPDDARSARGLGVAFIAGVVAVMVVFAAQAFREPAFAMSTQPVQAMQAVEQAGLLGHRV
ncbi:MAG: hypothetical protein JOZ99_10775, partial [Actinobacteria bacterium]|nr:hypothetical protein [Actinomycetota bacterium]